MQVWQGIRKHWHTRWPEWLLAFTMLGEATILARYDTLNTVKSFQVLASMISDTVLSVFGFCIGALWVAALFCNGTFVQFRRISPWIRVVIGVGAACYWALWAYTMYQGNPAGTGWWEHFMLSLMAAVSSLQVAGEVALADERALGCRQRKSPSIGHKFSKP